MPPIFRRRASWLVWGLVYLAGCTGGGTTGHEGLDVRTPPPMDPGDGAVPTEDAPSMPETRDASSDARTPDDVIAPMDTASAVDGASLNDSGQSKDVVEDTQRIRDGAVVRDINLGPPGDASGDGDATVDTGPPTVCGDGKKEGNEECDDGNKLSGDGCSAICTNTAVCDACLAVQCADPNNYPLPTVLWPLCSRPAGNATTGEGAGRPRKDLCQDTYACALRSQCMDWTTGDVTACYCGTTDTSACLSGKSANGPCRAEIDNGMETTDINVLLTHLSDDTYASGAALAVRRCAFDLCYDQCAPKPPSDGGTVDAGGDVDAPQDAISQ